MCVCVCVHVCVRACVRVCEREVKVRARIKVKFRVTLRDSPTELTCVSERVNESKGVCVRKGVFACVCMSACVKVNE